MTAAVKKATELKGLRLLELSLVDRPANKHAVVSIFKRADEPGNPENPMATKTDAERITELEKGLADAIAAMKEDEKLKAKAAEDLTAMTKRATDAEAKVTELTKAAEIAKGDEVYEANGTTIRKSAVGPEVFAVLKGQNEAIEIAKAQTAAETLYPSLPGTPAEKGAAIRLIDAIRVDKADAKPEDHAAARASVHKLLAAGEAAMKMTFNGIGHGRPAEVLKAEDKLEVLAKAYQEKNPTLSYEAAYAKVLETPDGSRLYTETTKTPAKAAA